VMSLETVGTVQQPPCVHIELAWPGAPFQEWECVLVALKLEEDKREESRNRGRSPAGQSFQGPASQFPCRRVVGLSQAYASGQRKEQFGLPAFQTAAGEQGIGFIPAALLDEPFQGELQGVRTAWRLSVIDKADEDADSPIPVVACVPLEMRHRGDEPGL